MDSKQVVLITGSGIGFSRADTLNRSISPRGYIGAGRVLRAMVEADVPF